MNPKSHTLFHFTKSKETLKLIFKNGFWPRYCLENIKWVGQEGADYMAFPMVCFCDIPLGRISDHVGFYGEFGLGMTKEWANSNGLNPILYLATDNNLSSEMSALNTHASNMEESHKESAKKTMRYIYMHTKPTDGHMIVEGKPLEKEFYQESEWRYVPKHKEIEQYLKKNEFDDQNNLDEQNRKTKDNSPLKFTPKDIKYIFVKTDADIPDMINFIQQDLDHYPGADLKILMSRVISLESIQLDL